MCCVCLLLSCVAVEARQCWQETKSGELEYVGLLNDLETESEVLYRLLEDGFLHYPSSCGCEYVCVSLVLRRQIVLLAVAPGPGVTLVLELLRLWWAAAELAVVLPLLELDSPIEGRSVGSR